MELAGMEAAVYLRKSRMEEGQSTEAVLARHRAALIQYAQEHDVHIIEIYPEVVSGESLYARPQMLRLLEDVESEKYDCVLCMDMDRLSRGSMRDQGIILDAFKFSSTLIVTPDKVYDLSLETDEQYAELKTFISRQEYKAITKRLRRGLNQSIADGCYVANAPYGYRRVTVSRKPTLEIYDPEAAFVRMMFELYASGMGCTSIARKVNALGARPHRSMEFSRNSVKKILDNPVYIGKIVWNQKKHIKKGVKGNPKHITIYQPKEKWTITDGIHPAIIDQELYERCQAIMEGRYIPSKQDGTVKSSLAGLVRCEKCGRHMQRLPIKNQPYLACMRPGCCAMAKFNFVEERVLSHLEDVLSGLQMDSASDANPDISRNTQAREIRLAAAKKELAAAEQAKKRLYELVESGTYSAAEFRERMDAVKERIAILEREATEEAQSLEAAQNAKPGKLAAEIRRILDVYSTADPAERNALLKGVVEVIWYRKEKKTKPADFTLRVLLKGM